jgi:membrane glycosyltransferase
MPTEQRNIPDQRSSRTKPLSRYSLRGRRKKARRAEEDKNYYVDRYEPRYFFLVSLILALCVLDAYFTLRIIEFGGKELNLLMLFLMEKRPILAMVIKYLATAICVVIILVHKNFIVFGKLKVYYLIYVVFFIYFILVIYEATFFFKHVWLLDFDL